MMKLSHKFGLIRLTALLLILCMGLSFLTACGKDDKDDKSDSDRGDSQQTTQEPKQENPNQNVKPDPEPEKKEDPKTDPVDAQDIVEAITEFLADYEDEGLSLSISGLSLRMEKGEEFFELTDGTSESVMTVLAGGKIAGDGSLTASIAKSGDASEDTELVFTLRDGVIAFSDGENAGYIELNKMAKYISEYINDNQDSFTLPASEDETEGDFDTAGLSDWILSDLLPLLGEVYSDPDSNYPLLFSQAISNLTDFSLTNTQIGVNYPKLYTLNEKLATVNGKAFINYLCGKGSYDVIMKDYEAALSVKPKNLLQYLDMKGFDEEMVISAVENFKKLQGEENFDLKQYLIDEGKKYDTVAEMLGVKDDASELKNELENKSMYAILLEHFPDFTEILPDFCDEVTPLETPLETAGLTPEVAELAKTVEAMIRKAEETIPICSISLDPLALTLSVKGLSFSSEEEDFSFSVSFDASVTTLTEKPDAPADKTALITEAKDIVSVKPSETLTVEGKTVSLDIAEEKVVAIAVSEGEKTIALGTEDASLMMRFDDILVIFFPDGVHLFRSET